MSVALLKPYRSGPTLMMRGDVGAEGVSQFFPIRIGTSVLWRGKNASGDVIYAYPIRQGSTLLARTIVGPQTPVQCNQDYRALLGLSSFGTVRVRSIVWNPGLPYFGWAKNDVTYNVAVWNGSYPLPPVNDGACGVREFRAGTFLPGIPVTGHSGPFNNPTQDPISTTVAWRLHVMAGINMGLPPFQPEYHHWHLGSWVVNPDDSPIPGYTSPQNPTLPTTGWDENTLTLVPHNPAGLTLTNVMSPWAPTPGVFVTNPTGPRVLEVSDPSTWPSTAPDTPSGEIRTWFWLNYTGGNPTVSWQVIPR